MTRIHDNGRGDPLEFNPDQETTDLIAAELCRQRYLRELRERWDATMKALAQRARNLPAAREAIRDLLGDHIIVKNENGGLYAEIAVSDCALKLVAGARSVLYLTTEPIRIPLQPAQERK